MLNKKYLDSVKEWFTDHAVGTPTMKLAVVPKCLHASISMEGVEMESRGVYMYATAGQKMVPLLGGPFPVPHRNCGLLWKFIKLIV